MYRIYIPLVHPSVLIILIYITEFTLNFMAVEGDKKFLQTTFGSYVAPAVVDQIIKNPSHPYTQTLVSSLLEFGTHYTDSEGGQN